MIVRKKISYRTHSESISSEDHRQALYPSTIGPVDNKTRQLVILPAIFIYFFARLKH